MHNPYVIGSDEWLAFRKPSLRIAVKSQIVNEGRPAIMAPNDRPGQGFMFRRELEPIPNSREIVQGLVGDPTPEQVLFGSEAPVTDALLDEMMAPLPPAEVTFQTPAETPDFGAIFKNNEIAESR